MSDPERASHLEHASHLERMEAVRADVQQAVDGFSGEVTLAWYDFRRSEHLFLDADRVLPAASLIKLPILGLALREAHLGRLDLKKRVAIRIRDRAPGAGVIHLLQRGLHLTIEDLLTLMIVVSDNTATNRLISLLGIDAINAWSREMGLERTTLVRLLQQPPDAKSETGNVGEQGGDVQQADVKDGEVEHGDRRDDAGRARRRNETSAADILGLLMQLERGDLLPPDETALAKRILLAQQDRAAIGRHLPLDPEAFERPLRLASKSGELAGVRHDAGIVYDADGSPLWALVVLTSGSADRAEHVDQEGARLIGRIAKTLLTAEQL